VNQSVNTSGMSEQKEKIRAVVIPIVFILLAGFMLADPWAYEDPVAPATEVPAWAVDITPVRTPRLQPEIEIASYTYQCSECHALFPSPSETTRPLTQHRHIRLEHGINNRCFNCHHRDNRDVFVDYKGDPIPYDQPQLLCAKCHGPVYRDWTNGVHGRTDGYWNTELGEPDRKKCIECHDPHTPAFAPLKPAPGPNTLRLGTDKTRAEEESESRNPLLIYRQKVPHISREE